MGSLKRFVQCVGHLTFLHGARFGFGLGIGVFCFDQRLVSKGTFYLDRIRVWALDGGEVKAQSSLGIVDGLDPNAYMYGILQTNRVQELV